ncbi:hypothetical protein LEP1GSC116_0412 [Leptospira interrogans serovar Icterohaemorrhagiae str. Verdun HP]|uniref:Uncharacterized protein n=2 Tax=Leptospira interrogans TaxID=173 RepID=M6RHQ0_LEPIR|nr:hypothetical protein LEP1GSC027_2425 [Leptospira interrogans str. 2002000624]EKQ47824.1 hypothetical protein LEP1GSC026_4909 [Leptospira interrogans str. 2002000623]EMF32765.1 hypothetical protein LEP1GSC201_1144 [Leptospira interrogans serovar Pomona str. Fox 32256]EMJ52687.1 hypothetical protein LEP1GSC013_3673 [Leptospira interrogans serovar Valbuzzi str. Duyster]EMJ62230.1 hypothetical protein LEP1GSC197_3518 [Leptospira interrogans serovar Pomona str. CSL4002]EMO04124.1 hypothetical pr
MNSIFRQSSNFCTLEKYEIETLSFSLSSKTSFKTAFESQN